RASALIQQVAYRHPPSGCSQQAGRKAVASLGEATAWCVVAQPMASLADLAPTVVPSRTWLVYIRRVPLPRGFRTWRETPLNGLSRRRERRASAEDRIVPRRPAISKCGALKPRKPAMTSDFGACIPLSE